MSQEDGGWIKIWRKWKKNWLAKDPYSSHIMLHLITDARWGDTPEQIRVGNEFVTVERGEVWTTIRRLSEESGVPVGSVYRCLTHLENGTLIRTRKSKVGTVITILNYRRYQDIECDEQNLTETRLRTQAEHERNYNKKVRKKEEENTPEASLPGILTEASKGEEDENAQRIVRPNYSPSFEGFWELYDRKGDKKSSFQEFQKQKLQPTDLDALAESIRAYSREQPEKKFRKDFERFLKTDWRAILETKGAVSDKDRLKPVGELAAFEQTFRKEG